MVRVLESGVRRTFTTAARGAASADAVVEASPECPQPANASDTATTTGAATAARIEENRLGIFPTPIGPQITEAKRCPIRNFETRRPATALLIALSPSTAGVASKSYSP